MRWSIALVVVAAAATIVAVANEAPRPVADPVQSGEGYVWTFTGHVRGLDMVVDDNGYAYVTGTVSTPGFPTTRGAYDRACGTDGQCNGTGGGKYGTPSRSDAFVTKIAPDGSVIYSTYFGGRGDDIGRGIAVDAQGRAHIIVDSDTVAGAGGLPIGTSIGRGCSESPRPGGTYGIRRDVVVVRLNAQGSDLDFATCIGGTGDDFPQALAVDDHGFIYVTGRTDSTDLPMVNALQPVLHPLTDTRYHAWDIFVAKLDASGRQLVFSTYLGGGGSDIGNAIVVDRDRNITVLGYSSSRDFPLVLPQQKALRGESDIVLTKLDTSARIVLYSTYFGTDRFDWAPAIAADRAGNVFVAGSTQSNAFPVTEGVFGRTCMLRRRLEPACSGDAFLFSVDTLGRLRYSTYLGGTDSDQATDVAVDDEGRAVIAGETSSADFPGLAEPLPLHDRFPRAAFVVRLAHGASALLAAQSVPAVAPYGSQGQSVDVDSRGNVYVMGDGLGSQGLFVARIAR